MSSYARRTPSPICGDYSTGLNDALESDHHPLSHPDDRFAEFFAHLDLSDAYLQVEVEEESRKQLTVNTHRDLYQYNRLPPGVKPAPEAIQRITNSMVAGIPGVKTRRSRSSSKTKDEDGILPDPSKTEAIAEMQSPKDVQHLRSYLGAINY